MNEKLNTILMGNFFNDKLLFFCIAYEKVPAFFSDHEHGEFRV
jgi:hypothetical protein